MTSDASWSEKRSVRPSSVAVSCSSSPALADRRTSDESSSADRAPESSTFGSTPIARSNAFALPLSSATAGRNTQVNAAWNGITTFAVASGSASAKFFGTSSPMIIDSSVAMTIAVVAPTGRTSAWGSPIAVSGPASSDEIAGSIV